MPADLSDAWICFHQGDLNRAAAACETALRDDPLRPDALYLLGIITLHRGDPDRAVTLLGRAVAARPDSVEALVGLAEAYSAIGQLASTVGYCREALRLRPDSPEILCNLGATLVDLGQIDAGIGYLRDAIRLRPDFAVAHNNLADALRQKGDFAAALDHAKAAARLDPTSVEALSNLGKLLLEQGDAKKALVPLIEAVRLRPGFVAALVNLGNVLHQLGRLDEAESRFRQAIQGAPQLAAAHAGLAGVLEQSGDPDRSIASLREALRLNPKHPGVLGRLATRLRQALPDRDLDAINHLLADPRLPADQRSTLLFGLTQVFDARGDYDRAAELSRQANALQLADLRSRGRGYDPAAHTRFVDELHSAFIPEFFDRVRGWGLETNRPIFVVGMPRSGTSLIEQILASHPAVFGAGELTLANESFGAITGKSDQSPSLQSRLDADSLREMAQRYLTGLNALNPSAERVVDKMPENTLYLGWIAAAFPNAKIIHCRRDLRDVALSCWLTRFGQVRWASDPDHITSRIHEYTRLMNHWRRLLPTPMFEVDYEAVVADLEGVARRLIAFCGLDWNPACLDFHKTRRSVRTASVAQVRQPIHDRSVGRWRNYERSLAALFDHLESA